MFRLSKSGIEIKKNGFIVNYITYFYMNEYKE